MPGHWGLQMRRTKTAPLELTTAEGGGAAQLQQQQQSPPPPYGDVGGGCDDAEADRSVGPEAAGRGSPGGTHRLGWSDEGPVISCPFHKTLIFSLTVFGLFYPKNFGDMWGKVNTLMMFYSPAVVLIVAFNTARMLATAFDAGDDYAALFNKINYVAWFLLCSFNIGMHYYMSFAKGGVRRFYEKKKKSIGRMAQLDMIVPCMIKVEVVCLVVGWSLVIANTALACLRLFDAERFDSVRALCRLGLGNSSTTHVEEEALRYLMAAAFALASGAWIWPVVYIVNTALHLSASYKCLNKRMRRLVSHSQADFLRDIGKYRRLHRGITECVEVADSFFQYTIGVHVILYLLLSMMEIYNLVLSDALRQSDNADLLASYIIWLAASLVMLAAECYASSLVAHNSRATCEILYKFSEKCDNLEHNQIFQVQLFLSQLESPSGFNVMGLFALNKESVLTIMGTWITYFLLVLQFAPPKY